jgi:UDP-N-acetylmuramoyl-L-alanyl-D-glutamate--2,6-diaminopimelate ligase
MELTELLNSVKAIQVIGEVQRKDVSGIHYDSRRVVSNSVFAAIRGFSTDGHKYIMPAISQGAIAVILEDDSSVPDSIFMHRGVTKILVKDSRKALAEISSAFYKNPSGRIRLTGITGTNGKTTTSFILKSILENSGYKTGLIGTIANYIGEKKIISKLTTPEANDLNEMLLEMYTQGCSHGVMEVSSHSLILDRVYTINFNTAVFTNITSDHLDFHGSFEHYLAAKKMLFDQLESNSYALVNIDDKFSDTMIKDSKGEKYTYGISEGADFRIKNITYDLDGTRFELEWKDKNYAISTSLIGEFNAYNAAAAFAAGMMNNIDPDAAVEGIKKTMYVPGRFEVIGEGEKKVIVDYSHTADSLEQALKALRRISGNKEIVTVFGCGGNRDKSKRPVMGKVASELSDKIIITSDNPRFEDPFEIIKDITTGISSSNYTIIEDREEAIAAAVRNSSEDSVILIAGKGHEDYQERHGVRNHFSDKETAEKYLS